MHRFAFALALAFLFVASPAWADDADTRFHDAYVREVIDGEIAEAAKAYLDLVSDDGVPAPIRAESRFRFAICTVLLGRPDEGRMQLAAIVANERTPKNLRERAQAYLDSVSTLGIGTELERKLQSLVFDLGRTSPYEGSIPAYRDFEIIGKPAIPFLEKLLTHDDVNLRRHAFRLLICMGAEDLVARWSPAIAVRGPVFSKELTRYVTDRPEELRRFEAKLLALDDEALRAAIQISPWPAWSLEFARALTTRTGSLPECGFIYLSRAGTREEQWAFVRDCMLGDDADDADRRATAAGWAVSQAEGPPDDMVVELWPHVLEYLLQSGIGLSRGAQRGSLSGKVGAWVKRLPTDVLLESLAEIVDRGREPPAEGAVDLLRDGPSSVIAEPLATRELTPAQLDAYEALVRRWIEAVAPRLEPKVPTSAVRGVGPWVRELIQRLPPERAPAFVRWLFQGPAHERAAWFEEVLRIERPGDVGLLLEAVSAVEPAQRQVLARLLVPFRKTSPDLGIARTELDLLPAFLRRTSASKMNTAGGRDDFWVSMIYLRGRVPDEDLKKAARALFETAISMDEDTPQALFDRLTDFRAGSAPTLRLKTTFFARFVLPTIKRFAEDLPVPFRRHVLRKALFVLNSNYPFEEGERERIAWFVLQGVDDLESQDLPTLSRYPDLFPLEHWVPWVAADALRHPRTFGFKREDVDRAMKVLTPDLAKVNQAVLNVLVGHASPEVARRTIDRMLASDDPKIRNRAVAVLPMHRRAGVSVGAQDLASAAGLEAALASLLAEESPDLGSLARIALLLADAAPSVRLLPAAERLLASDTKEHVVQGIRLASRLGREELVPALTRHLDSLDSGLRDSARKAISAIREVKRFKEEAEGGR